MVIAALSYPKGRGTVLCSRPGGSRCVYKNTDGSHQTPRVAEGTPTSTLNSEDVNPQLSFPTSTGLANCRSPRLREGTPKNQGLHFSQGLGRAWDWSARTPFLLYQIELPISALWEVSGSERGCDWGKDTATMHTDRQNCTSEQKGT